MSTIIAMTRTHVILDGLQDPLLGQQLSARWAAAGFDNAVDVAGQSAWLEPQGDAETLSEDDMDKAGGIARAFGLELRDRVGENFVPDNDLPALRDRLAYEYKSRFATALVFGLPALVLHYVGPMLAGEPTTLRGMFYPWLIQCLLVGWACIAAGWPILWQGAVSLVHLRATADLLTSAIIAVAFVPSTVGLFSLLITTEPWLPGARPAFHAATYALFIATLHRWLMHRAAARLSGRATLMLGRYGRLIQLWLLAGIVVALTCGWHWGLAVALLLPPMMSSAAINPYAPRWTAVLPVMAFAIFVLLGQPALRVDLQGVEIETCAGFASLTVLIYAWSWRNMKPITNH